MSQSNQASAARISDTAPLSEHVSAVQSTPEEVEITFVDWTENLSMWLKENVEDWNHLARAALRKHPVLWQLTTLAFGSTVEQVASRR